MLIVYFGSLLVLYLLLMMWRSRRKEPAGKRYLFAASVVFTLILLEVGSNIVFYVTTGRWVFLEPEAQNTKLWEPHPYLVGMNKKSVQATIGTHTYTHNSSGYRGEEFHEKGTKIRVVAIGGSTTYGVGVNDNETWPYYLDSLLGDDYEVLNLAIPGHATIEHIIQTDSYVGQLEPDIILIHAGLNDMRVSHVDNLEEDYSNFHAPSLFGSFDFCYLKRLPKLATVKTFAILFQKLGWYPVCPYHQMEFSGEISAEIDSVALGYFTKHVNTLIDNCDGLARQTYFVPQVINKQQFKASSYEWWMPFVEPDAIEKYYSAYNHQLELEADTTGRHVYIRGVSDSKWETGDFSDPVHLGPEGNLKLAKLVAEEILMADTLN